VGRPVKGVLRFGPFINSEEKMHNRNSLLARLAMMVVAVTVSILTTFAVPPDGVLDGTHANVRAVMAVQANVTASLMRTAEVLGTAVGIDDAGDVTLVVYVDADAPGAMRAAKALPAQIGAASVQVHLTDKFRAFPGKPGSGSSAVSHTAIQTPPIQLGTSGGWRYDLANGYCCGGTLGSLVQINGDQYILSNYHVFESDIVLGGNSIVARTGDPVIQPGLIDVNCSAAKAQSVATLVKISSLPNANVDCSVAKVVSGMVKADGSILEIGTISSQTVAPTLKKAVKKSGRTTGLTRSSITGLNATVSVAYDNECAGGAAFTKTFTGQIVISNSRRQFLNSGDSGSLMVEDVTTNPRAVGLLFAGSSTSAIANPIGDVLTFLGATMVGK
jgi:hypothetical protein